MITTKKQECHFTIRRISYHLSNNMVSQVKNLWSEIPKGPQSTGHLMLMWHSTNREREVLGRSVGDITELQVLQDYKPKLHLNTWTDQKGYSSFVPLSDATLCGLAESRRTRVSWHQLVVSGNYGYIITGTHSLITHCNCIVLFSVILNTFSSHGNLG